MRSRICNVHLTLKDITKKTNPNNTNLTNKRNVENDSVTNDNYKTDGNEIKKQKDSQV